MRFVHRWSIAARLRQDPPPSTSLWPIRRGWLQWWSELRRTDKQLTAAFHQDKASYVRQMYDRARATGSADFAHLIRSILRTGRKFKIPSLVPVLDEGRGEPVIGKDAVLRTFALHFGSAERARPTAASTCLLRANRMRPLTRPLAAENIPSLARLCRAFASFTPGLSGLGTTIYKAAPHQAALAYMPIACKAVIKGTVPLQWSGGRATPIPKPEKPPGSLSGWRSILLLESDAKALQKSMRDSLVETMERGRASGQHGGLPGHTLAMPAAAVRAHFLHLNHSGGSGGAIFVNSASAYYAIVRDFLAIPAPESLPVEELQQRAAALYSDAEQQAAYVQAMRKGNILEALQAPEETCRFVAAQLRDTWFITDRGQELMRAESGTAPGSPIVDALFGIVYAKVLWRIHQQFGDAGITATISHAGQTASAGEPTWADDSAFLFTSRNAREVAGDLATAARIICEGIKSIGLAPNYGANKTEAVLVWRGPRSRVARREILCTSEPGVDFTADGSSHRIRVVPGLAASSEETSARARPLGIDTAKCRLSSSPSGRSCCIILALRSRKSGGC